METIIKKYKPSEIEKSESKEKPKMEEQIEQNVKDLKPVESKGIDLESLEGQKSEIEFVEIIEVTDKFSKEKNKLGKVLRVRTKPIITVDLEGGEKIEIRASELFNLVKDKEGDWGWSENIKGKLQKFLNRMKVKTPQELIGRQVTIRVREKIDSEGNLKNFLGLVL